MTFRSEALRVTPMLLDSKLQLKLLLIAPVHDTPRACGRVQQLILLLFKQPVGAFHDGLQRRASEPGGCFWGATPHLPNPRDHTDRVGDELERALHLVVAPFKMPFWIGK